MNEWISVKDRLPEDNEVVVIVDENGYFDVGYMAIWGGQVQWCSHLLYDPKVTHWMPIPEPPKEE